MYTSYLTLCRLLDIRTHCTHQQERGTTRGRKNESFAGSRVLKTFADDSSYFGALYQ
jgi:hypothetical protein